jgi:hypothetical protein
MTKLLKTRKYKGGNNFKLCFIIACKVYKTFPSFIDTTIKNINTFYPKSTIILVDNNSTNKEYFNQFKNVKNVKKVIIIENTSDSKFELGAYNYAIKYLINNKLKFDYYTLLQDTVIPVNKYDYNILKKDNTVATSIFKFLPEFHSTYNNNNFHIDFLKKINIYDEKLEFKGCAFVSFICNHESLMKIHKLTKNLIIKIRSQSEGTERIFGRLLQYLNNNNENTIINAHASYNTLEYNLSGPIMYFRKIAQHKKETTVNKNYYLSITP